MIGVAIGILLALLIAALSRAIWAKAKQRRQQAQTAFWLRVEHID
jgi:hypothetical protein